MESYKDYELTEDEIAEGLLWAVRTKQQRRDKEALLEKERANRERSQMNWSYELIKSFMLKRAVDLFKGEFFLDEKNTKFFDILCSYFIGDETEFQRLCATIGVEMPSIKKGLLIPGNCGVGKSWMLSLFRKNARQVYYIRSAKDIANAFLQSEDKTIPAEYIDLYKNPINDAATFYQPIAGLCIDDMGAENKKNSYGNVVNVIGDLIEARYFKGNTGVFLHASTNLSAAQLKEFYGERVVSRMREIFNFIELPGQDRRK